MYMSRNDKADTIISLTCTISSNSKRTIMLLFHINHTHDTTLKTTINEQLGKDSKVDCQDADLNQVQHKMTVIGR